MERECTFTRVVTDLCIGKLNAEGGREFALRLLRGESHLLIL